MAQNKILILDFGGQDNQLIARRVRECNVYSEVRGFESTTLEDIKAFDPKGIYFYRRTTERIRRACTEHRCRRVRAGRSDYGNLLRCAADGSTPAAKSTRPGRVNTAVRT